MAGSDINLVIDTKTQEKTITTQSPVPSELVKKINSRLTQPEYKTILREPVKPGTAGSSVNCIELVLYKGAWIMPNDPVMHKLLDRNAK